MKLVICEKPSVGAVVAAALGVREKKNCNGSNAQTTSETM